MILPGMISLQGGAERHRVSDASAASGLDCELSRRQDAGRGEDGPVIVIDAGRLSFRRL
jgi:hypothetical protein